MKACALIVSIAVSFQLVVGQLGTEVPARLRGENRKLVGTYGPPYAGGCE